ncbi:MAG: 8-oxo-dGTP diphosphatase [Eubacteriales bacterium]|nr:8-oxo-dGTP diphosphatase [Eubacteriales bacterium]
MKSPLTTLCYMERDGKYLMMHRIKKKNDVNEGKWIGVGGHFEPGESPEECLCREVREETGVVLTDWRFRGIVTFTSDDHPTEYMCLYTANGWEGSPSMDCEEGELRWIPKEEVTGLPLWEGDRIFLRLLAADAPFFSLKLTYRNDRLTERSLNGKV